MNKQKSKKTAANECEEIFDQYVSELGGEIVHSLFGDNANRPSNADYMLFNRTVVAELKCLTEDYFSSQKIGEKTTALLGKLLQNGDIPAHFIDGKTVKIPDHLAPKFIDIFINSIKTQVESANKQIKITKKHFGLPEAKGLIIIVNENNKSLAPEMAVHMLSKLFRTYYSSINSFIYLVPTMDLEAPELEAPTRAWISGPTKDVASGVDTDLMEILRKRWIHFLEKKYQYKINVLHSQDYETVKNLKFIGT